MLVIIGYDISSILTVGISSYSYFFYITIFGGRKAKTSLAMRQKRTILAAVAIVMSESVGISAVPYKIFVSKLVISFALQYLKAEKQNIINDLKKYNDNKLLKTIVYSSVLCNP